MIITVVDTLFYSIHLFKLLHSYFKLIKKLIKSYRNLLSSGQHI